MYLINIVTKQFKDPLYQACKLNTVHGTVLSNFRVYQNPLVGLWAPTPKFLIH